MYVCTIVHVQCIHLTTWCRLNLHTWPIIKWPTITIIYEKLTECIGCSSTWTSFPTPTSGWDGDGNVCNWGDITGVLTHSNSGVGTFTACSCPMPYAWCWGHINVITINIKLDKISWSQPANPDGDTLFISGSCNLVHNNIQWSSWYFCKKENLIIILHIPQAKFWLHIVFAGFEYDCRGHTTQ